MLHARDAPRDAALIHVIARLAFFTRGGEAGADIAGHDGADLYAEGLHLVGQRHGVGVDRRLAGGIVGLEGDRHDARDGAEIHDAAVSGPAHDGQDGVTDVDHAEEIDLELLLCGGGLGEFDGAGDAEARVVDEHVDVILLPEDLRDRGVHHFRLRHVGRDMYEARDAGLPAAELIDGVALLAHGLRRAFSDPGGASGDDADFFAHRSCLLRTSAITPTASSISSWVCVAIRLVRSRHSCGAAAGGSELLT